MGAFKTYPEIFVMKLYIVISCQAHGYLFYLILVLVRAYQQCCGKCLVVFSSGKLGSVF